MQHIYSTRPIWILLTTFFSLLSLLRKKTQLLKIDSKLIIFTYWNWVWDILRERANFTHIFIWRKTKLVAALHLKALKWIIHLEPKFEYVVSIKVFFWKLWIFSNSHQHEVCIKAETFEGTLPVHREPQTSSE